MAETDRAVGGQSRPSQGAVQVTPEGKAVGTAATETDLRGAGGGDDDDDDGGGGGRKKPDKIERFRKKVQKQRDQSISRERAKKLFQTKQQLEQQRQQSVPLDRVEEITQERQRLQRQKDRSVTVQEAKKSLKEKRQAKQQKRAQRPERGEVVRRQPALRDEFQRAKSFGKELVQEATKPSAGFQKFQKRAERRGLPPGVQQVAAGGAAFGAGVIAGSAGLVQLGKRTAAGTKQFVTTGRTQKLQRTGKSLVRGITSLPSEFKRRPIFTAGTLVAPTRGSRTAGRIGRAARREGGFVKDVATGTFRRQKRTLEGKRVIDIPREGGGTTRLTVAGGVESTKQSLPEQVQKAGTRRDIVSAQRGFFKRKRPGRKKRQVAGGDDDLGLFFDPDANIRTSRLPGQQKEATLADIVKGRATFKREGEGQVLVQEQQFVENVPADIRKRLESGKDLTQKQAERLRKQQQTPTGQAKPIGFLSKESEVTLAPGEVITKRSTAGTARLEGQRVGIARTGVKKTKQETQRLQKKAQRGEQLTRRQKRQLKQETGFKPSEISSTGDVAPRPVVSASRVSTTAAGVGAAAPRTTPSRKPKQRKRPEPSSPLPRSLRPETPQRPPTSPQRPPQRQKPPILPGSGTGVSGTGQQKTTGQVLPKGGSFAFSQFTQKAKKPAFKPKDTLKGERKPQDFQIAATQPKRFKPSIAGVELGLKSEKKPQTPVGLRFRPVVSQKRI